MCQLCDDGQPQDHSTSPYGSRRDFLKTSAASAAAAAAMSLLSPSAVAADPGPPQGPRQARAPLRHPRWLRDVDGPGRRRVRAGRRAGGGLEDRRRRPEPPGGGRGRGHRRARPRRHAGLHRHPPPPVRDRAAELPRQRHPHQRRLGHAERGPHVLRVHPAAVRARVPARGRVHQHPVRRAGPARRRRHHRARHLADPPLAAALRRRDPGAVRHGATRCARLFRERGQRGRQHLPAGRAAHRAAVVLLQRPARPHDHGRRGLPRRADLHAGVEHRALARPAGRRPHPLAVRHPPDPGRPRPGHGRRQQRHRAGPRQPVHPHDRDVRPGLAGGQGRRRPGLDRLPDRDEHAARDPAHSQDAEPRHGAVAELRRRGHDDRGLLHPDALAR